jgi:hypothetical protein
MYLVSLGLGLSEIQNLNTIPNPPTCHGAETPSRGEEGTVGYWRPLEVGTSSFSLKAVRAREISVTHVQWAPNFGDPQL